MPVRRLFPVAGVPLARRASGGASAKKDVRRSRHLDQSKRTVPNHPAGRRLPGIEGLRAIAASSVLVWHVWLYGHADAARGPGLDLGIATKLVQQGSAGVTLFFVLSGFLLYRPFAHAVLGDSPWPSVRRYARNRALRILPAYWFILAAVTVLFQRELVDSPLRILANAFFVREWVPAYSAHVTEANPAGSSDVYGIVPAWSLAIEIWFYILLPVIGVGALWLATRSGRRMVGAIAPAATMLAVGVGSQAAYRAVPELGEIWENSLPLFTGYFAAGMMLAVVYVAWTTGRLRLPTGARSATLATGLVVGVVGVKLWYAGAVSYIESQGIVAISMAFLVAFVLLSPSDSATIRILQTRPFVAAGLASYSVFLWHDPILRELRDAGLTAPGQGGFFLNVLLLAGTTGVASALTYRFVERPALARKRQWRTTGRTG